MDCTTCHGPISGRGPGAKYCSDKCKSKHAHEVEVASAKNRTRKERARRDAGIETRQEVGIRTTKRELIGSHLYVGGRRRHARKQSLLRLGWTVETYKQAYAEQGGKCFLCGRKPLGRSLHADHDHKTGKARHLLCALCNRYIGMIEEGQGITLADNGLMDRYLSYIRPDVGQVGQGRGVPTV